MSRVDEIRKRLKDRNTALYGDATSQLGSLGVAKSDIEYLLSQLKDGGAEGSILRPLCKKHPHIRFVDGVLGGVEPLIEGHRVGVSHLLGRMAIGMSITEYKETWNFSDETIKDAFAYAQDVIDALIDRERATAPTESSDPSFRSYLAEQMKDPKFRAAYEQVSAEEDAKLATAMAESSEQCGEGCCGHDPKFRDDERRCWYNVNGVPCVHRCGWVTFGRVVVDVENETETFIPAATEQAGERIAELGVDTNFSLSETLRLLVEWAQHLHVSHECDCDGWEQRSFLIEFAQRYRDEIKVSATEWAAHKCAWLQDGSDYRWYKTSCGRETDSFDGGFCTYCGKVIEVDGKLLEPVPATPVAQPLCYWCQHPDHGDKVCPVPHLAIGNHGVSGSYPCGCTRSTVIDSKRCAPSATAPSTAAQEAAKEIVKAWLWHTLERDQDRARESIAAIISKHCGGDNQRSNI